MLKNAGPRIMSTFVQLTERCVYIHSRGVRTFDGAYSWHSEYYFRFLTIDLGDLAGFKITDILHDRVCVDCLEGIKEMIDLERTRIWNDIPSYFGLGDWGEVRAKLRARAEDDL